MTSKTINIKFKFFSFASCCACCSLWQTCLSCAGVGLGAGDAAVLAALLPHHKHLQALSLDDNPGLLAGAAGEAAACALAAGLQQSATVRRASLRRCGLQGTRGAALLASLGEQKPGLLLRCLPARPELPRGLRRRFEVLSQVIRR